MSDYDGPLGFIRFFFEDVRDNPGEWVVFAVPFILLGAFLAWGFGFL